MKILKIKVCGLKDPENIKALIRLKPDFMGFIFYPESPRFVGNSFPKSVIHAIPDYISRVGVFVNEKIEKILSIAKKYKLNYIQLHGDETPAMCKNIREEGFCIIKAISVENEADIIASQSFYGVTNHLLFDTKGKLYGGSGIHFDWDVLKSNSLETTFFISGGIGLPEITQIHGDSRLLQSNLFAIDVNSRFEIRPGVKDKTLIQTAINMVKRK